MLDDNFGQDMQSWVAYIAEVPIGTSPWLKVALIQQHFEKDEPESKAKKIESNLQ